MALCATRLRDVQSSCRARLSVRSRADQQLVRLPPVSRFLAFSAALLVVCAVGGIIGAQQPVPQPPAPEQPPPQQPIFRAKVELVRVDVSVTGRDDETVDDLKAEEFEVEEDGLPQTVDTVQFIRLTGQVPPTTRKRSRFDRSTTAARRRRAMTCAFL